MWQNAPNGAVYLSASTQSHLDRKGRTKRYPMRSVMNTLLVPAINDPRELATKINDTLHQSRHNGDSLFE